MTIAIWCILIAAVLPYVAFNFVKGLDPNEPRVGVGTLTGQTARAYGAQLNGFETFPLFAAAVIVAHMVGGPAGSSTSLSVLYVLLRLGHMAAYIAGRQPLRSAAFDRRSTRCARDFRFSACSAETYGARRSASAAAADIEERSGHVGRCVAQEPDDRFRNFAGRARPPERARASKRSGAIGLPAARVNLWYRPGPAEWR